LSRLLVVALIAIEVAAAATAGAPAATNGSPIRVTLSAENHRPRPSENPAWHWSYCVRVASAAGGSVTGKTTILLQIVSSRAQVKFLSGRPTPVKIATLTLNPGYPKNDHRWCAAIGGEDNVLAGAPRGKRLVFQAVVTAMGVTVKRNWPIVVQ
jgi:hypothetical protein